MRTNKKKYSKTEDALLVLDFVTESNEHIVSAEAGLLELVDNPKDKKAFNRVFCSFHYIMRTADFLGFSDISSLARSTENILHLARRGHLDVDGEKLETVFLSISVLKKMIDALKKTLDD